MYIQSHTNKYTHTHTNTHLINVKRWLSAQERVFLPIVKADEVMEGG